MAAIQNDSATFKTLCLVHIEYYKIYKIINKILFRILSQIDRIK